MPLRAVFRQTCLRLSTSFATSAPFPITGVAAEAAGQGSAKEMTPGAAHRPPAGSLRLVRRRGGNSPTRDLLAGTNGCAPSSRNGEEGTASCQQTRGPTNRYPFLNLMVRPPTPSEEPQPERGPDLPQPGPDVVVPPGPEVISPPRPQEIPPAG